MRLTRTSWLILVLGVFVVAFASLCVVYSGQAGQQKDLKNDLAGAEARHSQLMAQITALESQLLQRQSNLAAELLKLSKAEAAFPQSVPSIDYDETLFEMADDSGLQVMSLSASEPRQEKVGDVTYTVTTFGLAVKGEVASLLDFVHALATSGHFTTAAVEVVDIGILEPPTGGGQAPQEAEATISLVIYGYPRQ